jgi:hypothetical protein
MQSFAIRRWHLHLKLALNIWLFGVSWRRARGEFDDIGIYIGPLNIQIERCDRHPPIDQEILDRLAQRDLEDQG